MSEIVIDIEADGLLREATQIHCAVTQEVETGEIMRWHKDSSEKLKEYLNKADKIIGHNIIAYDAPMLARHWGITIKLSKLYDTLVMSRLEDSSKKRHSLRDWGDFLNFPKGDCEDFSHWTQEMEEYCVRDVEVTSRVYSLLKSKLLETPQSVQDIEHMSQYILEKQREVGFELDVDALLSLKDNLDREYMKILETLTELFPPRQIIIKEYIPKYKQDGEMTAVSQRILNKPSTIAKEGKYYLTVLKEFCIDSPSEIVFRLKGYWKPSVFTKRGQPKVCEENLNTIFEDSPQSLKDIARCKICKSRSKLLQTYLDSCWGDNRAHGSVVSIGTKTHRMSHKDPNTGNIPSKESYKGTECRAIFKAAKGYKIVGCDASGIQLRALAHYVNDPVLIKEITSGDIHTYMASEVYGLGSDDIARSRGKTVTYSILMGAGNAKIGSLAGTDSKGGKKILEGLSAHIHGWEMFKKYIQKCAYQGFFKAIDGSKIPLESAHYGMSAFLQSFEQAIIKYAMISIYKEIRKLGIDAHQVAVVHDELQYEVAEEETLRVAEIMERSIVGAGVHYKCRCPLAAEYKIGNNWAETH